MCENTNQAGSQSKLQPAHRAKKSYTNCLTLQCRTIHITTTYKASVHNTTHTASTMQQPDTYNSNTLPAALPRAVNSNNTHMHGSHTHSATADTKTDKMSSRLASGLAPRHHQQAIRSHSMFVCAKTMQHKCDIHKFSTILVTLFPSCKEKGKFQTL